MMNKKNKCPRRLAPGRSGSNLIELVLTLPVLCMVLVQTTMIIRHVFQLTTIAKNRTHATLNVSRLERMLREDIHQASAANLLEGNAGQPKGFQLDYSDGGKIEYRIHRKGFTRVAWRDNGKSSVEELTLFDAMQVDVQIIPTKLPIVVVSMFRIVAGVKELGRLELQVESVVGKLEGQPVNAKQADVDAIAGGRGND
jgi:hypothetical protein